MRRLAVVVIVAAVAVAVVGGVLYAERAQDEPVPVMAGESVTTTTTAAAAADPLSLTCPFGPTFAVSAVDGLPGAEQGDDPLAAALREGLAKPELSWMPRDGWSLLGRSDSHALFGVGSPPELAQVVVEKQEGTWRFGYSTSRACRPDTPGLGQADWVVAPDLPRPGPGTTSLDVIINETDCSNGESADERLEGPEVSLDDDAVTITFLVRPLGAGALDCRARPSTRRTVHLEEPIGDRALQDGGVFPPRAVDLPPVAIVSSGSGEVMPALYNYCLGTSSVCGWNWHNDRGPLLVAHVGESLAVRFEPPSHRTRSCSTWT